MLIISMKYWKTSLNLNKGLCNNYLVWGGGGNWEMGEIHVYPKTKSYPPLIKQKLISTPPPPSHNENIKGNPPHLKNVSSH